MNDTSCVSQERDDLNPCWRSYNILLYSRCFMTALATTCSKSIWTYIISHIHKRSSRIHTTQHSPFICRRQHHIQTNKKHRRCNKTPTRSWCLLLNFF
jgi:hypothetical protein